jgi:hypothetical protein
MEYKLAVMLVSSLEVSMLRKRLAGARRDDDDKVILIRQERTETFDY